MLLLFLFGAFVLVDWSLQTRLLHASFRWWPAALIALGVEGWIVYAISRRTQRRLSPDYGWLLVAAMIVGLLLLFKNGASTAVAAYVAPPHQLEQRHTTTNLGVNTKQLVIVNPVGTVTVQSGPVDVVQVDYSLWADKPKSSRKLEFSVNEQGDTLTLRAEGRLGWLDPSRYAVRLLVTVPEHRKLDVTVHVQDGSVEAAGLPIDHRLTVEASNGEASVMGIEADVSVRAVRAKVRVANVGGNLAIAAEGGSVAVTEAAGAVNVTADQAQVHVNSAKVGGDWKIVSKQGDIAIGVPPGGDFRLEGSSPRGGTSSRLPIRMTDNVARGEIGSGTHLISIHAANGDIAINQWTES